MLVCSTFVHVRVRSSHMDAHSGISIQIWTFQDIYSSSTEIRIKRRLIRIGPSINNATFGISGQSRPLAMVHSLRRTVREAHESSLKNKKYVDSTWETLHMVTCISLGNINMYLAVAVHKSTVN